MTPELIVSQSSSCRVSVHCNMIFAVVGVLLVSACIGNTVGDTVDPCADAVRYQVSGNFKNPESGYGLLGPWNCMSYYNCVYNAQSGAVTSTKKYCWFLLPLRQYDPTTRECEWFWKVNCEDNNPVPTPA